MRAKLVVAVLGLFAFFGVLPAAPAVAAVPGALDLSFGERGVVSFQGSPTNQDVATARSMAVGLENGLFVLQRSFGCGATGCAEKLTLQRFLPGGSLDSGFGGGAVSIPLSTDSGSALAVSPDGKPLVAVASGQEVNLLRLNQDGTRDASFGGDGIVTLDYGGSAANPQVRVLGSGEIVLALDSRSDSGGRMEVILARFLANGDPNPTFAARTGEAGGPGWLAISTDVALRGLAVSDSGQITLVGCCLGHGASTYERRRADGRLLNGLDATRPWKRLRIGIASAIGSVIALPSGRVYVVGREARSVFAAKLRADGSLERRYGRRGIVRIGAMNAPYVTPVALVDGAGRLVVAGTKSASPELGGGDLLVSRRLPGGGRDSSFGDKSIVDLSTFGLGRLLDRPVSIGIQSSGRIVLFGKSAPGCVRICPPPSSALVRLFGGSAKARHHRHHRR